MRSGCIYDHMDGPQEMEMDMNATLARRANELGVQVIIEGMGGHVQPREDTCLCRSLQEEDRS